MTRRWEWVEGNGSQRQRARRMSARRHTSSSIPLLKSQKLVYPDVQRAECDMKFLSIQSFISKLFFFFHRRNFPNCNSAADSDFQVCVLSCTVNWPCFRGAASPSTMDGRDHPQRPSAPEKSRENNGEPIKHRVASTVYKLFQKIFFFPV